MNQNNNVGKYSMGIILIRIYFGVKGHLDFQTFIFQITEKF